MVGLSLGGDMPCRGETTRYVLVLDLDSESCYHARSELSRTISLMFPIIYHMFLSFWQKTSWPSSA
jgi:hypothetical protein